MTLRTEMDRAFQRGFNAAVSTPDVPLNCVRLPALGAAHYMSRNRAHAAGMLDDVRGCCYRGGKSSAVCLATGGRCA